MSCHLNYKNSTMIVSNDPKWSLSYKCIIALAFALAGVVNYNRNWCFKLWRHSLTTLEASFSSSHRCFKREKLLAFAAAIMIEWEQLKMADYKPFCSIYDKSLTSIPFKYNSDFLLSSYFYETISSLAVAWTIKILRWS